MEEPAPTPLADALECVGDRWTLLVVAALLDGPRRFGELAEEVSGISPNVLTDRLRRLADERLVLVEPYSTRPPRFTYELTERGRALAGPIRLLTGWAAGGAEDAGPVHAACGSRLEAALYCPTCREPVSEEDADRLDYA